MREILFRGKRIDNGEWVMGDIDTMNYAPNPKHFVAQMGINNGYEKFDVIAETVGQFTGLCDKNGKKIFEGDVLKNNNNPEDLCKVCFSEFLVADMDSGEDIEKVVGWNCKVIQTDELSICEPFNHDMPLTDFYIKECEQIVIGNIHDNKELVEVNND